MRSLFPDSAHAIEVTDAAQPLTLASMPTDDLLEASLRPVILEVASELPERLQVRVQDCFDIFLGLVAEAEMACSIE